MNRNNDIYKLFVDKDYSAIEIVNLLHSEIQCNQSTHKTQLVIESLEVFLSQHKNNIYNIKIELEREAGNSLRYLTNQLAAVVASLENIINNSIAHYKNGIKYILRKLQQMKQEIAVIGLYLEI